MLCTCLADKPTVYIVMDYKCKYRKHEKCVKFTVTFHSLLKRSLYVLITMNVVASWKSSQECRHTFRLYYLPANGPEIRMCFYSFDSVGDTIWVDADVPLQLTGICRELFPVVGYAVCTIPTYLTALSGFVLASNNKVHKWVVYVTCVRSCISCIALFLGLIFAHNTYVM